MHEFAILQPANMAVATTIAIFFSLTCAPNQSTLETAVPSIAVHV